jgi:hypothetical protein
MPNFEFKAFLLMFSCKGWLRLSFLASKGATIFLSPLGGAVNHKKNSALYEQRFALKTKYLEVLFFQFQESIRIQYFLSDLRIRFFKKCV